VTCEKCQRNGRAWTADVITVAIIDFWWVGCIGAAQAVGHNESWMASEIGGHELLARRRGNDDVHIIEEHGDLLNGQRSRAVGLDVFDGRIKARGAKQIWSVFRTLRGKQLVAA
jgi:hypothetical protein